MFTLLMEFGKNASKAISAGIGACKVDPSLTAGQVAQVILKETAAYNPVHKGHPILTPGLRVQLAQALAGLSCNIAAAEAGRKAA